MTEIGLLLVSFLFAKIFPNDFTYKFQGKSRTKWECDYWMGNYKELCDHVIFYS